MYLDLQFTTSSTFCVYITIFHEFIRKVLFNCSDVWPSISSNRSFASTVDEYAIALHYTRKAGLFTFIVSQGYPVE